MAAIVTTAMPGGAVRATAIATASLRNRHRGPPTVAAKKHGTTTTRPTTTATHHSNNNNARAVDERTSSRLPRMVAANLHPSAAAAAAASRAAPLYWRNRGNPTHNNSPHRGGRARQILLGYRGPWRKPCASLTRESASLTRGAERKPGASSYTRKRLSHAGQGESLVPVLYTRKRLSFQADIARHVIRCHITQATSVQRCFALCGSWSVLATS